ncbi:MAG: hypothetical protein ACKV2O_04560 [Acidimicrobiales bacterium]
MLEHRHINLDQSTLEPIAVRYGLHRVRPQGPSEAVHETLQGLAGARRRFITPQSVDQTINLNGAVCDSEGYGQAAHHDTLDHDVDAVVGDLEGAEHGQLHGREGTTVP